MVLAMARACSLYIIDNLPCFELIFRIETLILSYSLNLLLLFFIRYFGAAKDLPGVRELFEQERE